MLLIEAVRGGGVGDEVTGIACGKGMDGLAGIVASVTTGASPPIVGVEEEPGGREATMICSPLVNGIEETSTSPANEAGNAFGG